MNLERSIKAIFKSIFIVQIMIGSLVLFSCNSTAQNQEHKEIKGHDKDGTEHGKEVKGHDSDEKHAKNSEHRRDKNEGGEGEESGTEYKLDQTYDVIKKGIHLILSYDTKSNSFIGTVENTKNKTIKKVKVGIHLSNGIELGPTKAINMAGKAKQDITLKATEKPFTGWSAHAEIGSSEHGHGEEDKEHARRERGEHDNE
jgi:hypothetical protein